MSSTKNLQIQGNAPAVLVIDGNKFQRRCLTRLMRAAGADRVTEAVDVHAALGVLLKRAEPRWLLVADPDRLEDPELHALRELVLQHPAVRFLLLTERRHPAAAELQTRASRIGLPLAAAVRKPLSAEETGMMLRRIAALEDDGANIPALSEEELNECLRAGRLRARFQPQIDLQTGAPVACEAFSYLVHPRHGEIAAAGLGFTAAKLGAQRMLTASLLREAAGLVRMQREKKIDAKVGVDMTFEMLSEPSDANALDAYVRTLGIAPHDLALELQSSRQRFSAPEVSDNLARLKLRGYALVLEQGVALGAPALPHFTQLKLRWKGMQASEDHELLERALGAAHDEGMNVCALGLDTASDLEQAREAGFNLGQGASIAVPMTAEEAAAWMEREQRQLHFAPQRMRHNCAG
jgi:EAL domain-containing protein (putative c-di-GMP-specific phosphodiesterase class I)